MNMKFYLPKEELVEHENFFNKDWERKEELKVEVIKNGIVLPFKAQETQSFTSFNAGIVDENFNHVPLGYHIRYMGNTCTSIYKFNKEEVEVRNKKAIFLGYYFNHFGHSLIESLTRVWYCIDNINHDYDYVFIPIGGYVSDEMFNPFMEQLELFGFNKNQIKFINKITQYKEIVIPEQSWGLDAKYHQKQIDVFNKIALNVKMGKFKKVYFSRTKLTLNNLFGEEIFEEIFKNNGYEIIYPETLNIKEQISIIKGAEIIAGVNGSALHTLVYAKESTKAIIFNRLELMNCAQQLVNKMKKLNAVIIKTNIGFLPVLHGPGPFLIGLTSEAIEFFKNNGFNFENIGIDFKKVIADFVIKWTQTYSDNRLEHNATYKKLLITLSDNKFHFNTEKLLKLFEPLDYLDKKEILALNKNCSFKEEKKLKLIQKVKREIKRILKQIKVK